MLESVGPLPHARLDTDGESTAPKKQKARMLKCECATCGYTVRTARKWLEQAGAPLCPIEDHGQMQHEPLDDDSEDEGGDLAVKLWLGRRADGDNQSPLVNRSEEHTSELQSLMRNSYAVFCLKKKKKHYTQNT